MNYNEANHSYHHHHPVLLQPITNRSDIDSWNSTDTSGTAWLRDVIKSKLVPTICLVGIVGNLLTLIVLVYQRLRAGATAERKVTVWLQALAASDLLLCAALLPHGLMTYDNRIVYTSLSFQLLYKAYGAAVINNFILTSTWITVSIWITVAMSFSRYLVSTWITAWWSTWITVAMSFSRYLAVCHPLNSHQHVSLLVDRTAAGGCRHKGTRFAVGVIFVACFLINLPRFFEHRVESYNCALEPGGRRERVLGLSFDTRFIAAYTWLYLVSAIVVPLVVLAFCNVRLVAALYRSHRMSVSGGRRTPQTAAGSVVTTTMIAVVLMYAVLVAPGEILTCITKHLLTRYDQRQL